MSTWKDAKSCVTSIDTRFCTQTGGIDLLAMSRILSPDQFRYYIECSRVLRALRRMA